jgi:hypothetical protein
MNVSKGIFGNTEMEQAIADALARMNKIPPQLRDQYGPNRYRNLVVHSAEPIAPPKGTAAAKERAEGDS